MMLQLSHVEFAYSGSDRPALRDCNLKLDTTAITVRVGSNGAGKSTLIRLLTGQLYGYSGSYLIMVPLSTARYSGSEISVPGFLGSRSGSFLIASTYSLARRISGFLVAPYGWLVRRRLLHVFRVEPVFNLIYAGFLLCLGGVLALEWNQRAGAVFSVVGTLLTLTLIQLATADCDAHFREPPLFVSRGLLSC